MLESVLKEHPEVSSVDPVESNIVIFTLASLSADAAVRAFADMGIACFAFGPHKIRLVTHRDVRADSIEEACLRLASWNSKASH
jgi:threonine aldolase